MFYSLLQQVLSLLVIKQNFSDESYNVRIWLVGFQQGFKIIQWEDSYLEWFHEHNFTGVKPRAVFIVNNCLVKYHILKWGHV